MSGGEIRARRRTVHICIKASPFRERVKKIKKSCNLTYKCKLAITFYLRNVLLATSVNMSCATQKLI